MEIKKVEKSAGPPSLSLTSRAIIRTGSVSLRQIELVLVRSGLLSNVEPGSVISPSSLNVRDRVEENWLFLIKRRHHKCKHTIRKGDILIYEG